MSGNSLKCVRTPIMGCHCLAWLAFLCRRCLRVLLASSSTKPAALFKIFRWINRDSDTAKPAVLSSSATCPSSGVPGTEFASGSITLGDIIISRVTSFEKVWSTSEVGVSNQCVTFYRPVNLPQGFSSLGFLGHPNEGSADMSVLVAKTNEGASTPALASPVGYTLVWSCTEAQGNLRGAAFFWKPTPPNGYASLGDVVSTTESEPGVEEVMCVRSDLTQSFQLTDLASSVNVWNLTSDESGAKSIGIPGGTFFSAVDSIFKSAVSVSCLKETVGSLSAMPSLVQLDSLVRTYAPVVYFHPQEKYFPSSVLWLFEKGVFLYAKEENTSVLLAPDGSNLPQGGSDDDEYWIDLPNDENADQIKLGNLSSAEVYVHAKPVQVAMFTDIAIWLYYPFNGPSTAKFELVDLPLGKIGEHVSDWEHVTLRVDNLTGKLYKVFFSQHSGGEWVDPSSLEYSDGGRFVVYSAKYGHASYPHPGLVLQGDYGVGIRNDMEKSDFLLDCSQNYKLISAEYLGGDDAPEEPAWLQYMRKWGPKLQYDLKEELDKVIRKAPSFLRHTLRSLFKKIPYEVFGEEGPTGPKEKPSWLGDEVVG